MNKTILRTISLIMAFTLVFGTFKPGQAKSQSVGSKVNLLQMSASATLPTIVAEADSRVREASPNANYGADVALNVDGDAAAHVESYIRFTVTGISGTVNSAQLRVYVTDGTQNGPVIYTTDNTWTETGITWSNRPAKTSAALQDKGTLAVGTWVDYDVTSVVTGNGTYSFVLATDATDLLGLSSREGSAAPQLVVTLADTSSITQPTATPTTVEPTATVVEPTATPTTILASPTPTTIQPTATPTTVLPTATAITVQPTATTSSQTSSSTTSYTGSGMWISSSELMSLPMSGTSWDKIKTAAYGSWGTPDLKDQSNKNAIYTVAGALVYARTGDASLRLKVKNAIIAAKRSLDESSEWQTTNGVLAAGRQIGAYAISADLISLKSYDSAADNEFRSWLGPIRTTNIGTHSRWKNIRYTCENATGNWDTFACASRIAASIYLGDTADVQRSSLIIRALLGERSAYPKDAPGKNGYFEHTAAYQASWSCDATNWTGDNTYCVKSSVNTDGVLVEDASRGGGCCVLQGDGIMYSWEALQGLVVSVELLYRTGGYGNPYTWSNNALKRTLDFMQRSGWAVTPPATYVPWLINYRYGTSYPTTTTGNGRIMAWGDWLYKK